MRKSITLLAVGPSGCGKSVLLRKITEAFKNDYTIREVDEHSIRLIENGPGHPEVCPHCKATMK